MSECKIGQSAYLPLRRLALGGVECEVELVISDAHPGLKNTITTLFAGGRLATLLHPSPAMTPPPRETPAPDGNRRGSGVPIILPTPRLGGLDEGGEIR